MTELSLREKAKAAMVAKSGTEVFIMRPEIRERLLDAVEDALAREGAAEYERGRAESMRRNVFGELDAPCVFCGYMGANYWQPGSHERHCPWWSLGGFHERAYWFRHRLREVLSPAAFAAPAATPESAAFIQRADDPPSPPGTITVGGTVPGDSVWQPASERVPDRKETLDEAIEAERIADEARSKAILDRLLPTSRCKRCGVSLSDRPSNAGYCEDCTPTAAAVPPVLGDQRVGEEPTLRAGIGPHEAHAVGYCTGRDSERATWIEYVSLLGNELAASGTNGSSTCFLTGAALRAKLGLSDSHEDLRAKPADSPARPPLDPKLQAVREAVRLLRCEWSNANQVRAADLLAQTFLGEVLCPDCCSAYHSPCGRGRSSHGMGAEPRREANR